MRASDLRAFLVAYQMPVPDELGGAVRPRVYVVAADDGSLKRTKAAFAPLGAKVEVSGTSSRVEAILDLAEAAPQLVVIDASDDTAFDLVARLRKRSGFDQTRLVLVAPRSKPSWHDKAAAVDADALLVWPIDAPGLVASLKGKRR